MPPSGRLLLLLLLTRGSAFPQAEPLSAGLQQERAVAAATPAVYTANMAAGNILHAVITQTGTDVSVELRDSANRRVYFSDAANGAWGPETIAVVAPADGPYTLEIRTTAAKGSFTIQVQALGPASDTHRALAAAFALFTTADNGRLQRTAAGRAIALEHYPKAIAAFTDPYYQGLAIISLGAVLAASGQYRPALEQFERAVPIFSALPDRRRLAFTHNFIGGMHDVLGDPIKSRAAYQLALDSHRAAGDRAAEGLLLSNIGFLDNNMGDFQSALTNYRAALPLVQAAGDRRREALVQHNLALTHMSLGDYVEGAALLQQALSIRRTLGDRKAEADTINALGYLERLQNRPAQALPYFEQVMAVNAALGDKPGDAETRFALGQTLIQLNRLPEAEEQLRTALSLAREFSIRRLTARILDALANCILESGDASRALPLAESALSEFLALVDRIGEAQARATLARIRVALGELAAARSLIDASISIAESIRSGTEVLDLRTTYLATRQNQYEFYIDLLMRMSDPEAAFAISERSRARGLLDMLAEAGSGARAGVPPELLARLRGLSARINTRASRLLPLYGRPEARPILEEIRALENERRVAEETIRLADPRYAAATNPSPIPLHRIRNELLDPSSVLLEYALGENRSFVWIVSRSTFKYVVLPPRREIERQSETLLALLPRRDDAAIAAAARQLSNSILAPVAAYIGDSRLLIVASGALQRVPFAMLPLPGSSEPLVTRHESAVLPSASTIALLRTPSPAYREPSKSIAIFADPVFTGAPVPNRILEHLASAPVDPAVPRSIPQLPFTRREAEEIARLTPKETTLLALGSNASRKAALDSALENYRYIHFATHGYLDPEHPSLSALLLSFRNGNNEPEDGFLRVSDIYNLRFNASLVVLSACQTGLGKEVRGEGLIGLPRAFLFAGVPRVVVSLWNVNDQATAELMRLFYRRLVKDGLRPAAALRQAQLALRKQNRWNSPYYWAAFQQQGEWR